MRHEYFPRQIKKIVEADLQEKPTPTFSGGDFAPDLMRRLKNHLRKLELVQIEAMQEVKEVVRPQSRRRNSAVMDQIEAIRAAARARSRT
jgi:hypothetical protein